MVISAACVAIHMRTDANNLVTTASTTRLPEQREIVHMIQMLRNESCSGQIEDLAHVASADCLSDCLAKSSAKPGALVRAVSTGVVSNIDMHPPCRSLFWCTNNICHSSYEAFAPLKHHLSASLEKYLSYLLARHAWPSKV